MAQYSDLLTWWAISISWSAFFLIVVSIYLYRGRKKRVANSAAPEEIKRRWPVDFVFVWVLAGLLGLYIVSIFSGSSRIFAAGNIVVEVFLIVYAIRNTSQRTKQQPN
jgi:hypothetical protein